MNLIMRMELTDHSEAELAALFARIASEFAHAKQGSLEWHGATISLDNIRREQAARRAVIRQQHRGPGI